MPKKKPAPKQPAGRKRLDDSIHHPAPKKSKLPTIKTRTPEEVIQRKLKVLPKVFKKQFRHLEGNFFAASDGLKGARHTKGVAVLAPQDLDPFETYLNLFNTSKRITFDGEDFRIFYD